LRLNTCFPNRVLRPNFFILRRYRQYAKGSIDKGLEQTYMFFDVSNEDEAETASQRFQSKLGILRVLC
jgi:hypothetical protein